MEKENDKEMNHCVLYTRKFLFSNSCGDTDLKDLCQTTTQQASFSQLCML